MLEFMIMYDMFNGNSEDDSRKVSPHVFISFKESS